MNHFAKALSACPRVRNYWLRLSLLVIQQNRALIINSTLICFANIMRKNIKDNTVFLLLILSVLGSTAQAQTYRVSTETELRNAITAANLSAHQSTIFLENDIDVDTYIANPAFGNTAFPTISSNIVIDANGFRLVATNFDEHYRFFYNGLSGTLTLNNIKLEGGGGALFGYRGGAILNVGNLIINKSSLSGNVTNKDGAAIANLFGNVEITNTHFRLNTAFERGGHIYNNSGSFRINNTFFDGNALDVYFNNDLIALQGGGSIYNESGNLEIKNSTVFSSLVTAAANGGSVYNNTSGVVDIENTTFSLSSVEGGKGGVIYNKGNLTLNHVTMTLGYTGIEGVAKYIYNDGGTTTMKNSLLLDDFSDEGGELYCFNTNGGTFNTNANNMIGANGTVLAGCVAGETDIINPGNYSAITFGIGFIGSSVAQLTDVLNIIEGSPTIDAAGEGALPYNQLGMPIKGTARDVGASEFFNEVHPVYPTVQFAEAGSIYQQGDGTISIPLQITEGSNFGATAIVYILNNGTGTALPDEHFDRFNYTEVLIDCSGGCPSSITVPFTIRADGDFTDEVTVDLKIAGTNGFAEIGGQAQYTVSIERQPLSPTAGILYVDKNVNETGDGSGDSWANAVPELREALNWVQHLAALDEPLQIWVAQGVYTPTDTAAERNATFQLVNNVQVYGGFDGSENLSSERDWVANPTILSGDINQSGTLSGNSYTVVTGSGTNNTAVIDGFTITGGNADVATGSSINPNLSGGGMYNNAGSPTVTNCTFTGNAASLGGGMCNVGDSSPTVTNSTFKGNTATNNGGGMYNTKSSSTTVTNITVTNCTFMGNTAEGWGGGMYNFASSPMVTNCTFTGNTAGSLGGGMFNLVLSSPTVTNCTFTGNTAGSFGGGMYNRFSSSLRVTNSIIWNNSANGSIATASASVFNDTSNPEFNHSLIANSRRNGGSWAVAIGLDGTNNIDVDPLFVAPLAPGLNTGGDYRLQACSPAINAGNNMANTAATDLDGNPRIEELIIDMGAYEFQGIAVCIPLSGSITWEHDLTTPVSGATVFLTGDDMADGNTDANGDYAIPTAGGNLTLTPTKTTGSAYDGVDVADVTRIQQHVTFIDRLDDGYKVIAADVNQSNSVTGLDAAVIFHALNGNTSAQSIFETPSWRFVDSTHTFVDENAPWPFPEDISLMNVMADVLNQSFVGAKMGDVNGTWATPVPLTSPPLSLMVQDVALKAGQTLRLPFRANGLPDVTAWQFALRFDTDYLRFERALPTAAFPLKDENFGAWQADAGELRSVFAVPQGLALPKDEVVFELEFQVIYDGLRLSEVLSLDNNILDGRVYNTALNGGAVALAFEAVETRRIASILPGEAALGFALEQNIPNPFSNETLVRFQLPEAGEAVFSVHDVQGRLLYEQRGFLDAGLHEVRLDAARLGATGVLSYTLRCGAHSATRRMVLVR